MSSREGSRPDVVVAGAGVAGLTAATMLARAGLGVVCVDPDPFPRPRVGESLDWSAPRLLADLGLARDELIGNGAGTYKEEIRGLTTSGELLVGRPPPWFHRWPLRFEHTTLHLDRPAFDQCLYERAVRAGVEFVWDRVRRLDFVGDQIADCGLRAGARYSPRWFLDASGRRRLVAHAAGIGVRHWGTDRIAMWSHYEAPLRHSGTVLHLDEQADELSWAWQIPIAPDRQSIGVVLPLSRFRALRRAGEPLLPVLADLLRRFPTLPPVALNRLGPVRTRAYRPYVSDRVAGANWMMVGEAAAFVDPLSSIGVASAMRNGFEAARLIASHDTPNAGAQRALLAYDRRVRHLTHLYSRAVEGLLYRPEVRVRFGMRWASRAYVPFGYLAGATYTRLNPTTPARWAVFTMLLGVFRGWVSSWLLVARLGRGDLAR